MDKNKIKSYAVWARRAMIEAVKDRAFKVGIEENKIHDIERLQGGFKIVGREEIFNIPSTHRDTLVKFINEKGYEQVIEEVAYTWFNRFMGLRFMEVNEYLPTGVRILSSEDEGKTEPDVLSKVNDIEDELYLNLDYVYELQDRGTEQAREELYKYILIKQCNELGKIIPQMFEKIQDYTELLLPDNLLQEGSVIRKMVTDIDEEDWKKEVEIIGWMYQYYISEKKDEVFAALKKNVKITKENIPAATQLFTPKWIVKYMVENSLGRLWLEGHPNEELQKEWKYYLEEAQQEPEVEEELKKIREEHSHLTPEDIKVLDPCMGSGHILVYAFDVLYQIYKEAGYGEREIPRKILQNNLYGLDIDDRAAQLASFALIMKARGYNRRLFREIEREELELNLCSIQESNGITKEAIEYFSNGTEELKDDIEYLINVFTNAKEYGSIIDVKTINVDLIEKRLVEIQKFNVEESYQINSFENEFREIITDKLPILLKQCKIMSKKYEICITNPPYMGNGFSEKLDLFIKQNYSASKSDLYAVFIEKCMSNITDNGFLSMITQQSWMFISSYEILRREIQKKQLINMIHLGTRAFEEISGEVVQSVTFTIRNDVEKEKYNGIYFKLDEFNSSTTKENAFLNKCNKYVCENRNFSRLPGRIIAYWLSDKFYDIINNSATIGDYVTSKAGIVTGDDNRFLRLWYEVNNNEIKYITEQNTTSFSKYHPISKGGGHRRYFGNNEYVVLLNDLWDPTKTGKSVRRGDPDYYFKDAITWSYVGNVGKSFRYVSNSVFGTASPSIFLKENLYIKYILGFLNGKISNKLLSAFNPTMNLNTSDISNLPVIFDNKNIKKVDDIVDCSIKIANKEWDSFETSWDFKIHPLLNLLDKNKQNKLESIFLIWEVEREDAFEQLKYNEEELNRIFIDIYGLQDELTPEVEDKDITIRKADRERDIRSFISYAVGCMFGRYSIDTEGLIYAGGDFNDKWYVANDKWQVRKIEKNEEGNVITDSWVDATFVPDVDNIIPITEDEYFEDDIVSRFIEFVKVVYGAETLEENLDFIAESLGVKANETSRQTIRRYFLKEFYKDHLKVYQKRPIYWMFDSGKNDGFKALVYMQRYNESTVAKLRTDYLHSLQRKYEAEILRLQAVAESTTLSAREKTQARKNIDKINKKIEECKLYDQVVAHVANERISIDLDDGVKHNYGLFQGIKVPTDSGKEVKMDLLAKI